MGRAVREGPGGPGLRPSIDCRACGAPEVAEVEEAAGLMGEGAGEGIYVGKAKVREHLRGEVASGESPIGGFGPFGQDVCELKIGVHTGRRRV